MDLHSEGRTSEPAAGASAGAWLKAVRQQRGLHIAALAVMLKVPQAKLEAIEADRWDELPDATFARALAKAMCRALKQDPAPVLALLPRLSERELDVSPGLNQPFRERSAPSDGAALALLGRPVVWGSLLLLAAAAAVYFVPTGWLPGLDRAAAPTPVSALPAMAASAPGAAERAAAAAEIASQSAASSHDASATVPAQSLASEPAPRVVEVPVASAPLQVREVPPPAAAAAASGPAVKVSAHADTWVEVVDGQGQLQFSRVIPAGQSREISGVLPLKVRVGNVTGARVEWRGAPVELASRAKDNIARVELK